jgi:hypothetical protein
MSYCDNKAIIVEVESDVDDSYTGMEVYLNGEKIGFRQWDGSSREDVQREVSKALADIIRERLGWPEEKPY